MTGHDNHPGQDSLGELLGSHQPGSDRELADLHRVRAMVAEAGDPWDRATPLHTTGSALVVHPPSRRVLLRWHQRQQAWIQVGGHADPGERDPLGVALREAREETGLRDLRPWPDARLLHLVVVPVAASSREPAHEHADVRFVLATDTPDQIEPENPDAVLRWLGLAEAKELTEPNVAVTIDRLELLLQEFAPDSRLDPV